VRNARRLRNLESHYESYFGAFTLPDGGRVRYTRGEVMAAVSAAIRKQPHHLHPSILKLQSTEGVPSMIRLVKALMESHERISKQSGAQGDDV
jgi:hypothetical protein